jgi:hypothetical protein
VKPGSHGWHGGGSRIVVWAAALGLLMGLVPAQGTQAAGAKPAAHPGAFELPAAHAVSVTPVAGGRLALPGAAGARVAAQALPGAGTGTVELGGASGGAAVRVGTLPVRVAPRHGWESDAEPGDGGRGRPEDGRRGRGEGAGGCCCG